MNRQQTQQLIEIINKLISKEVNRQMISLKTQILSELKRSPQYQQAPRQSPSNKLDDIKSRPHDRGNRPNIQYTSNPVLNEILQTTTPFEEERPSVLDVYGKVVNYVTEDVDGRPVDLNNPAVLGVLEAMNRNYSDVIEPIREAPKQVPQKQAPMQYQPIQRPQQPAVGNFKNAAIASMLSSDFDEDIKVPDAFSENEW